MSPKLLHFFPLFEKGQGIPPPPPSSLLVTRLLKTEIQHEIGNLVLRLRIFDTERQLSPSKALEFKFSILAGSDDSNQKGNTSKNIRVGLQGRIYVVFDLVIVEKGKVIR